MKSTALSASMDMAASLAFPFSQRALSIQDMDFNRCAVQSVYAVASRHTVLNMIGHANHAVALGNFLEGRVWIEDENGQATTVLETKNGQKSWNVDRHAYCSSYVQCSEISYAGRAAETCGLAAHTP